MTIDPALGVFGSLALIGLIGVIILSTKKGRDWVDRVLK